MKVLWFSVTPLSLNTGDNTGVEGKGWISSLLQLALAIEGLELVVAYENYSPNKKETEESERLKIVPINICRYSKREIIKDMMTYHEVDDFVISQFTTGPGLLSAGDPKIVTLSILIQDKIKKGPIPPQMRALTTIIFLLVVLGVIGVSVYRHYQAKKGTSKRERRA